MSRQEFLNALQKELCNLPESEQKKSVEYYDEIIGDRVEDGMSEEDAVAALGTLREISNNIKTDYYSGIPKIIPQKTKKTDYKWLWIVLIIISSPIWFPVAAGILSAVFSVYIGIWAVVFSLWIGLLALGIAFVCGLAGGIFVGIMQSPFAGLCIVGGSIMCGSIMLLFIKPMILLTKAVIDLSVLIVKQLISLISGKKGGKA